MLDLAQIKARHAAFTISSKSKLHSVYVHRCEQYAHAHADIPALVAEVERLRAAAEAQGQIIAEQSAQLSRWLALATEAANGLH